MKAIIYAGVGLITAASVYGITDFYREQQSGKLNNLYKPVKTEVKVPEKNVPIAAVEPVKTEKLTTSDTKETIQKDKQPATRVAQKEKTKRTMKMKYFSRGEIVEPEETREYTPVEPVEEITVKDIKN